MRQMQMALTMDEEELSLFNEVKYPRKAFFSETVSFNFKVLLTVLYTIILATGILGNLGVCTVIKRNPLLHTATNFYLRNLARSDIIFLICRLPLEIYRFWNPFSYPLGKALCISVGFLSKTCANVNVLTIFAFTVERYTAVCCNFPTHIMPKSSRVKIYIIAIWVFAIYYAVLQAMQIKIVSFEENERLVSVCAVKGRREQHFFVLSSLLFFLLAMSVITVLFVRITIQLQKSRASHPVEKSSVESGERSNRTQRFKSDASQRRVIRMLVAVALLFFLCWAPINVQRLIVIYGENLSKPNNTFYEVFVVLTYLSRVLYYLPAAINPLLYIIMSNNFRYAFKVTLTPWYDRPDRFQLERSDSDLLASLRLRAAPRTLQRSDQPLPQRPPLTVNVQLHEAPTPEQYLNQSILTVVNKEGESWHWRRQLAEGSNSLTSPQSISNSSLRELDQEQNCEELAAYLYKVNCEIIGETAV